MQKVLKWKVKNSFEWIDAANFQNCTLLNANGGHYQKNKSWSPWLRKDERCKRLFQKESYLSERCCRQNHEKKQNESVRAGVWNRVRTNIRFRKIIFKWIRPILYQRRHARFYHSANIYWYFDHTLRTNEKNNEMDQNWWQILCSEIGRQQILSEYADNSRRRIVDFHSGKRRQKFQSYRRSLSFAEKIDKIGRRARFCFCFRDWRNWINVIL